MVVSHSLWRRKLQTPNPAFYYLDLAGNSFAGTDFVLDFQDSPQTAVRGYGFAAIALSNTVDGVSFTTQTGGAIASIEPPTAGEALISSYGRNNNHSPGTPVTTGLVEIYDVGIGGGGLLGFTGAAYYKLNLAAGPQDIQIDGMNGSGRTVHATFAAAPEPLANPEITSITPLGDNLYELTLEGQPSTVFQFYSATDLVFDPGTLVENLAPGDVPVGTIGGPNNSLLTTDAAGDATAQMTLTGTRNFVRAQLPPPPPPLLEEDFEGGLPGAWARSDNGAGTTWSVGPPNGTGTEPPAAANGTQCAGTNINANYTNSALASLVTPAFTVPTGGATLNFSQFIDTEAATGGQDFGSIRLLNAADDSPLAGGEVATDLQGTSAQWTSESLPLPAAANGLELKLEFLFESDGDGLNFAGFYIDDVVVMPN